MFDVAICGYICSGKTSLANYISQKYGHTKMAFGDGVKEVFEEEFGRKPDKSKDRIALQAIGQTARLVGGDEYWVDYFSEKAMELPFESVIVVDDVRRRNELRYLRDKAKHEPKTVVVRINCKKEICEQRAIERDGGFDPTMWDSITEKEFLDFEVDIELDGSKTQQEVEQEFEEKLAKLLGV